MPIADIDLGAVRVIGLLDGDQELDHISKAFPGAPAAELVRYRERYPGVYGAGDSWHLRVNVWLIRHRDGLILFDTGVGPRGAPASAWFAEGGRLMTELGDAGSKPEDVDTVVISHVHDDHIGGTVTPEGSPAFPSARYLIQRADWEWEREWAGREEEDKVIWETLLVPLERAGIVDLIDGDRDVAAGVQVHHAPGHTPGHQVIRVISEDRRLVLSADTFNHPAQLSHPDWHADSDDEPARAAETRRELLAELDAHPGTILGPSHFAEPLGRVVADADGLAGWEPLGR